MMSGIAAHQHPYPYPEHRVRGRGNGLRPFPTLMTI